MENEKSIFRHESLQDCQSITKLLQAITDGLASGQLKFSDEAGEIKMSPKGLLHLKIKASVEEGRNSLRLSVRWQEDKPSLPARKSLKVNKSGK